MNFSDQLMKNIARIEARIQKSNEKIETMEKPVIVGTPGLYDIWKRNIPTMDSKCVGVGYTKEQADEAIQKLFKTKQKDERVVFYDVVPQNSIEAADIFWNPRPFVEEL